MGETIGLLLAPAAGVALSPFPVVAAILVLGGSRPRANGLAFAAGWLAGLGAVTAALVVVVDGAAEEATEAGSDLASWARVVVGALLVALAVRKWIRRSRPGDEPEAPRWMAALDDVEPGRAAGLGALLGGANPKNIAFTVAAATSIGYVGLDGAEAARAGLAYLLLASSTVLVSVGAHVVAGARVEPALASVKRFMLSNSEVILVVVLLVLGVVVLGEGLSGLS